MPLEPLPLASRAYELASRPASAQRLVNLYAEPMPEASRTPFILKPTPGLLEYTTVGTGPVWAMGTVPGILYVISGEQLFRVQNATKAVQYVGEVGPSGAAHSIAVGDRQVVVVNPPRAFVASHTGPLAEITDGANFPDEGASAVAYIDGFFCFTSYEGTFFFTSKLLDAENFDPLDFAKSERRPDTVQWCAAHNGELWLFGLNATAVWYNAGLLDFPFRERAGSVQDKGLASVRTLATLDRSLVFLASDRVVYRTQGYQLARISDFALEERLSRYPDLRAISGCSFVWEGHEFYALRLPGQDEGAPGSPPGPGRTYVYDGATRMWHERSSAEDGYGPWRVDRAQAFGVLPVLGSWKTGRLFTMDSAAHEDDGVVQYREAVLPPLEADGARQFMSRLEIEMDVGTGEAPGSVHLRWSDNGGHGWNAGRFLGTGAPGATRTRVAANRLGSFRQRSIQILARGRATIYGVDADITKGAH